MANNNFISFWTFCSSRKPHLYLLTRLRLSGNYWHHFGVVTQTKHRCFKFLQNLVQDNFETTAATNWQRSGPHKNHLLEMSCFDSSVFQAVEGIKIILRGSKLNQVALFWCAVGEIQNSSQQKKNLPSLPLTSRQQLNFYRKKHTFTDEQMFLSSSSFYLRDAVAEADASKIKSQKWSGVLNNCSIFWNPKCQDYFFKTFGFLSSF